jgi:hypothetical protein
LRAARGFEGDNLCLSEVWGIVMAIGWLTVLKMVPWGDVIENAPKVAIGAKKLWDKVGKKPATLLRCCRQCFPVHRCRLWRSCSRRWRLCKQATAELHQQMLDSTELIKTLAEQNTQLVRRVESNRKRLLWLAFLLLCLVVVILLRN